MKHIVEMLDTDKTPYDAIKRIEAKIADKKKPESPGQIVVKKQGKVVKVVTSTGKTLTDQSYATLLDVNKLLAPAMKKGLLRHVSKFEGEYDDIPAGDFQEAQFIVAKGQSMFEALPSNIRNKFEGSPAKFMEYVQNPENRDWLQKNGLLKGLDGIDSAGVNTGYNPESEIAAENAAAEQSASETTT